jgi:hypothetical protein
MDLRVLRVFYVAGRCQAPRVSSHLFHQLARARRAAHGAARGSTRQQSPCVTCVRQSSWVRDPASPSIRARALWRGS